VAAGTAAQSAASRRWVKLGAAPSAGSRCVTTQQPPARLLLQAPHARGWVQGPGQARLCAWWCPAREGSSGSTRCTQPRRCWPGSLSRPALHARLQHHEPEHGGGQARGARSPPPSPHGWLLLLSRSGWSPRWRALGKGTGHCSRAYVFLVVSLVPCTSAAMCWVSHCTEKGSGPSHSCPLRVNPCLKPGFCVKTTGGLSLWSLPV